MTLRMLTLAALLSVAAMSANAEDKEAPTPMERGREYTAWFHSGKHEQLFARMSKIMQGALKSADALADIRQQLIEMAGDGELVIVDEQVTKANGYDVYLRTSRWKKGTVFVTQFSMREGGLIEGFFVRPSSSQAATTPHLAYQTKTRLRLPFEGEWFVFWGGRRVEQNYHAASPDQRFAYDLLRLKDVSTFHGKGVRNADYYAFGQKVLAPAAGTVVGLRDGLLDNIPGKMDAANPLGNHVILDHGDGEFSFLAHLEEGSVAVMKGQNVEAGRLLGRCGNSGNSSEPHLHYHLQNTAIFRGGEGLPAYFERYTADGQAVDRGEPLQGQRIRPR